MRSQEYLNAIFDQYHRFKFKNRMFSLRNDLLSQFCVLFANSSLAANDFVDNRIQLDIKQSKCQELICIFRVPFQITVEVILFLSCIKTQFRLIWKKHQQNSTSSQYFACESGELCIINPCQAKHCKTTKHNETLEMSEFQLAQNS